MIIGILSDTHDRIDNTMAGLEKLRARGAEFYFHCGDVGGEQILDQLAGLPIAIVWGNNDIDRNSLARYATNLNIRVLGNFGEIELAEKRFAITHGDDIKIIREVIDRQAHDYLLVGHSHVPADRKLGRVRLINPGALHRAKIKTVALLDTQIDALEFLQI